MGLRGFLIIFDLDWLDFGGSRWMVGGLTRLVRFTTRCVMSLMYIMEIQLT